MQLMQQVVNGVGEGVQLVPALLQLVLDVRVDQGQHGRPRRQLLYDLQQRLPALLSAVQLSLSQPLRHDRRHQLGQLVLESVLRESP